MDLSCLDSMLILFISITVADCWVQTRPCEQES